MTDEVFHLDRETQISKKALKKQQKEAEKAKRKAETQARLVSGFHSVSWTRGSFGRCPESHP